MNAITPEHDWPDHDERYALPGRPRRQLLTWASAGLFALLLGAVGFYAGVRVEKGQVAVSASGGSGRAPALLAAGGAGAGAGSGAAGARARAGGARTGFGGAGGGAGLARLFGAGGLGGGAAGSFGTVSSISGHTLYLTDPSGNTIKVTLSSATKVTKSVGVSAQAVRPGDGVVIQGLKNSDGTMQAATLSDIGARAAAAGGGGAGSPSSSANSAVSSLFGSGG